MPTLSRHMTSWEIGCGGLVGGKPLQSLLDPRSSPLIWETSPSLKLLVLGREADARFGLGIGLGEADQPGGQVRV